MSMQFSGKVLSFSAERFLRTAGELFFYQGNHEAALALVEKTLEIAPFAVRALVLRGDIFHCLGRVEDALATFRQAMSIDPDCVEALVSGAGILETAGRYREALECCNRAFGLLGTGKNYFLPEVFDRTLSLLIRLNKYREAQVLLKKAAGSLCIGEYRALQAVHGPTLQRLAEHRRRVCDKASGLGVRLLPHIEDAG